MTRLLAILTTVLTLLSAVPLIRPRSLAGETLLWLPKLLGGALSPVTGLVGILAAGVGLARRDCKLAGTGLLGAGLAARLAADLPDVDEALAGLARCGGEGPVPRTQEPLASARRYGRPGLDGSAEMERDVVVGRTAGSDRELRADLWPPAAPQPSGLGLIYAHGSGWRVGDKDLGTRSFFRRLAAQGHLVLDLAYSLWPQAGLDGMVAEMNQAILWLKEQGPAYGVNPERIVVMGGSAGAHLALLAAYTPGHPAFRPAGAAGDTSVRGVVAFYPPVDLLAWDDEPGKSPPGSPGVLERINQAVMSRLFAMRDEEGRTAEFDNFFPQMLGGSPADIPDTYRLLSPLYHVGGHCPPTLLLQGSDDVFGLAPGVRRLHQALRAAGVPVALLEFPHTEHGFDLLLASISPPARAAARAVDRFLAWLA